MYQLNTFYPTLIFKDYIIDPSIIDHLINEAKKLNIKKISVETGSGDFFSSARKLFKKCGFKPCEPFAHNREDSNSCYFSLDINK